MNYKRSSTRLFSKGIDLIHPPDALEAGYFPFLMNVRGYQDGPLEPRKGLQLLNSVATADKLIHSIYRMNDYVTGTFARFLGINEHLYYGQTSFASIDSGYSGSPLSFVNYLPIQAVSGRTYIADAARMRKVEVDGTVFQMGIKPPNVIPTAELIAPAYTTPTGMDSNSPFNTPGSWGHSGHAQLPVFNPPTMPGRLTGVAIAAILYINGTSGWACVAPTVGTGTGASSIVAGMRMQIGTGGGGSSQPTGNVEYATVEEIHRAYPATGVTIGAIIYDSGTTGLCTIQPSANMAGITRNTMLQLGTGEYIRVISVTSGPDGVSSFRCSTVSNHTAGTNIVAPMAGNIWIYLASTHTVGEFLWQNVFQFNVNPGSSGGQGQVASNAATLFPYALAIAGGRPLTPDDYINLSLWVELPANFVQGTLVLDVDGQTTNTYVPATEGTLNAYIYTFAQGDLQQLANNKQTDNATRPTNIQQLLQAQTNLDQISPLVPPAPLQSGQVSTPVDVASTAASTPPVHVVLGNTNQINTGASQWTELKIKLSDFTRIGADQTADLTSVKAILLNLTVSDNCFFSMAGMWAGGTYGPDVANNLTPFIYRYRYRDSRTGAKSLPGPALRSGINAYRQAVQLTGVSSTDGQVDKIDWERLGGANVDSNGNPDWHYLGTCENSSPTIIDDQYSAAIVGLAPLDLEVYQPFPIVGVPLALTGNVSGTAVALTSGTVSTDMSVGTPIIIDGQLTTLYATPTSGTLFHVADSMGHGSFKIEIQEPLVAGTPLPAMWGPFQQTLFAVGNHLSVGDLYYTNAEDPDGVNTSNYINITPPTETLMNGFTFMSKCYVFSEQRMFEIIPAGDTFIYNEIISNRGLAGRWSFAVGPAVWFVSHDGIYQWGPGGMENITANISLLFPEGDRPGVAVNGLQPVDMCVCSAVGLRLCYYNSYLFFDYIDTSGNPATLVYDLRTKAWYPDSYFFGQDIDVTNRFVERNYTAVPGDSSVTSAFNVHVVDSLGSVFDLGCSIVTECPECECP